MTTTGTTFAALLADYRTERGLSQHVLGELAGLDGSYVSRLEKGERTPSLLAIVRLSEALHINYFRVNNLLHAAYDEARATLEGTDGNA